MTEEKRCTKCGETRPITDFHRNGGRRRASCKSCESARNAARREANPGYMAEWAAANPSYMADYRAANPEAAWLGLYRARAKRFGFEPVSETFAKADVVGLYGDQCWHCGEAPFEQLDHHPIPVAAGGRTPSRTSGPPARPATSPAPGLPAGPARNCAPPHDPSPRLGPSSGVAGAGASCCQEGVSTLHPWSIFWQS